MVEGTISREKALIQMLFTGMVPKVTAQICTEISQSWLFLLAVIRCYLTGALAKRQGLPRQTPDVRCFFSVHNSENSGG
jgi:hypothetical protein